MAVLPCTDQFVEGAGGEVWDEVVEVVVDVSVVDAGAVVDVGVVVEVEVEDVSLEPVVVVVVVVVGSVVPVAVEVEVPLEVVPSVAAGPEVVELVEVEQAEAAVPGNELGTVSTSPGWNVADISPLPAGPSERPSTWPSSWRTTVRRSMWRLGASDGKSTLQPQPAAVLEIVIEVPLVMPSSRSDRSEEVTLTHDRSTPGAIASQSEVACDTAADSSDAATAWLTDVVGAEAAVESAGFAVDVELVPVELVPVEVVPVELVPVELVSVELVPLVPVPVDPVPVELVPVEVEPEPLEPVPVEFDPVDEEPVEVPDEGDPAETV